MQRDRKQSPKDRGTAAGIGDVYRRGYNNRSKNGPYSFELITCGDFLALFVGIMNPHSLPNALRLSPDPHHSTTPSQNSTQTLHLPSLIRLTRSQRLGRPHITKTSLHLLQQTPIPHIPQARTARRITTHQRHSRTLALLAIARVAAIPGIACARPGGEYDDETGANEAAGAVVGHGLEFGGPGEAGVFTYGELWGGVSGGRVLWRMGGKARTLRELGVNLRAVGGAPAYGDGLSGLGVGDAVAGRRRGMRVRVIVRACIMGWN